MILRKDSFTERLGLRPTGPDQQPHVVPKEVRHGLITILRNLVMLRKSIHGYFNEDRLYWPMYIRVFTIPSIQRSWPMNSTIASDRAGRVPYDLDEILDDCTSNVFFDVVEACSVVISNLIADSYNDFEYNFNELCAEHGVQWILNDGEIQRRRSELIAETIEKGLSALSEEPFQGPRAQLLKALRALDQRPDPDVENCVKDAVGALEGTAQTLTNKPGTSLSKLLAADPFKTGIHQTLRNALLKVEAYRHDAPGAGHAMVTTKPKIQPEDAEFVLTTCVAGILLLLAKAKETS